MSFIALTILTVVICGVILLLLKKGLKKDKPVVDEVPRPLPHPEPEPQNPSELYSPSEFPVEPEVVDLPPPVQAEEPQKEVVEEAPVKKAKEPKTPKVKKEKKAPKAGDKKPGRPKKKKGDDLLLS